MKFAFPFTRALLINTLFDVCIISAVTYLAAQFSWETVFFGWLILLAARAIVWLRGALVRLLEHWLFRSERVEQITASLRVADVPRHYEIVSEFEALSQAVLNDANAGAKAKQLVAELIGYTQYAKEAGVVRGVLLHLTLDAAIRRYLA